MYQTPEQDGLVPEQEGLAPEQGEKEEKQEQVQELPEQLQNLPEQLQELPEQLQKLPICERRMLFIFLYRDNRSTNRFCRRVSLYTYSTVSIAICTVHCTDI